MICNAAIARGNWRQVVDENGIESADFYWKPNNLALSGYDKIDQRLSRNPKPYVFNHMEVNRGICQKTCLIRSLQTYYDSNEAAKREGYSVFDTTPTTFVIAKNSEDNLNLNMFMHRFKELSRGGSKRERVPQKHCEQNMWLVKPAAMNQGRGIEIFRNMKEINDFIFLRNQSNAYWVIQKYVEKPYLFFGRKFDIRMWVVLTEDFRIYIYREGYVRTSSSNYNLRDKNNYVHLTN